METIRLKGIDLPVSRLCAGGCPAGEYGWGQVDQVMKARSRSMSSRRSSPHVAVCMQYSLMKSVMVASPRRSPYSKLGYCTRPPRAHTGNTPISCKMREKAPDCSDSPAQMPVSRRWSTFAERMTMDCPDPYMTLVDSTFSTKRSTILMSGLRSTKPSRTNGSANSTSTPISIQKSAW